jgi:tetratricopeptide (TPR) repeat protein
MISWILLILSGLGLSILFVKRLKATRRDVVFQNDLIEEQLDEAEEKRIEEEVPEEPVEQEIKGSARSNYNKGDYHFGRKEFDEAEAYFLATVELDETHLDAHHKLGLIYMKREDFPKAELYFSKLVNLKKDPVYFSNLGASLYRQNRLIEAAEAYENAITLDDKKAERLESLAQIYHELGDGEKALKYFELAARRKPKDSELKLILADYYEQSERYDEAITTLKKALDSDPYNESIKGRLETLKERVKA